MCECGCSMNNNTYRLPGPGGSVYLITFQRACTNCDASSGLTIEKFESEAALEEYAFELPPELPLEKWPESMGCAVITGHRKHEFVKALKSGLIGLKSDDFADNKGDGLDETAAETILEDLYDESVVTPRLPVLADRG
jgi:hypothetical protein